jgi:hypothetical protein
MRIHAGRLLHAGCLLLLGQVAQACPLRGLFRFPSETA